MNITRTENKVRQGIAMASKEMTVDLQKKTISVGVDFDGETFPCQATFADIFVGYSVAQKQAINAFFGKALRIAINNGIAPDTDLIDGDIPVEL